MFQMILRALAVLALTVTAAHAQGTTADSAAAMSRFVASLQQAVAANDRPAVARMMRYPLDVMAGGLQIPVRDAAAFVSLYESLITPGMADVIRGARVPADGQAATKTLRTPTGGVQIDNALTIEPQGTGFAVVSLRVPTGGGGGPSSTSPGRIVGRQLTFRAGRPTVVSGTLTPGGVDQYEFFAGQGTFIDARIAGFAGRGALLRIVNSKTGAPVDARADAGTRVWNGRMTADAGYRIEVARQPDTGSEPLIYTLTVTLK